MANPFDNRAASPVGPGHDYVPVAPNDSTDLDDVAVALYVQTGGAVAFRSVKGNDRVVVLPDYGWILCGVRRVMASGTTAAGIHAVVIS